MSEYKIIYKKALYYLAKREYAIRELSQKLANYTEDMQVINSVISELIEKKYLSEERYIEAYVNSKKSVYGLNKIKYSLSAKVANATDKIHELGIEFSNEEQLDTATNLLIKKYRFTNVIDVDYAKAVRFLFGRGFDLDISKQAFKRFKDMNDET